MRVATVDIGTNSVLLLVAELEADGGLRAVLERATITRLGQGVDRTRALAPEAIERTLACLATYGELARTAGAALIDAVGTSAMRDAKGGEAFVARAKELLGAAPRVVSGDEEAALTCEGALSGLAIEGAALVFDVGGGSTEIIARAEGGAITSAVSLDVGSVRLTERHVKHDPPTKDELAAVRADVRVALAGAKFSTSTKARVVGVAGTVTTLAAHALGIAPYDGAQVHGASLSLARIRTLGAELAAMPLAERRALPALDPGRADVIVAGAILVGEVLEAAGASELIVSDRGVRWGLAQRLAKSARPD